MSLTGAITDAAFAAAMAPLGPWGARPVMAVAVSGGADSLALTWLTDRWARARGGEAIGLIGDHGLRRGSAAEADGVAALLRMAGIEAHVLTLSIAPGAGMPARARAARYAALTERCAARGIVHLLLGHHAADQAETLLMRRGAGSGPDGMAGMAALRHDAAVRVIRPLLRACPEALRATCAQAGLPWVTDPTNADITYLRTRLRAIIGHDQIGSASTSARAAGAVRAAAERARADVAARVEIRPEGYAILCGTPDPALCGALVGAVGGSAYPVAPAACARLAAGAGGTLAGARMIRRGETTLFVREARAVAPARPAIPGALWDGRFRVQADVPEDAVIGPWGGREAGLPAAACAGLPVITRDGRPLADPAALSWVTFAPARPLAPAAFVVA